LTIVQLKSIRKFSTKEGELTMNKGLSLFFMSIVVLFAVNRSQFLSAAPVKITLEQLKAQKAKIREEFNKVVNQLHEKPDNFKDALDLLQNPQWSTAEIASMATELFKKLCSAENVTLEMFNEKMQALKNAAPRLADTIARIEKDCKLAIAQRKASTPSIVNIINEWEKQIKAAKVEMADLEKTKQQEADQNIKQLQTAVAE